MIGDLISGSAGRNTYKLAKGNHSFVQKTVAIDSTGDKMTVEVPGDSIVSLNIEGSETADYALDVGPTNSTAFADEETYSGTDVRDSFQITDRYMTIRVTTAASAGSEATVTVQEAR